MISKKKKVVSSILLIIISGFVAAQILTPGTPAPAQFFPSGALVYWETPNLKEFLVWWKTSYLKADWSKTKNHKSFENSRLYLRLQERITEFSGNKYKFSLDSLITLSGKRSALAVYDIGNLKTLAVTEISQADAAVTELWMSREKFQQKNFKSFTYYADPDGKLSFAYAKPFLVLSTEASLLEEFLENTEGPKQNATLATSEKWLACHHESSSSSLFSIYLDQESLNQNWYFQRYWIHKNVKDFASIRSGWIDFQAQPNALIEHRYFSLTETDGKSETLETTAGTESLNSFRALNADFLEVEPAPDPAATSTSILKLVNRFPKAYREISYPPAYSAAYERAAQAESKSPFLVRIDDPVLEPAGKQIQQERHEAEITALLNEAKPAMKIRFSTPIWDNQALFLSFQETQILRLENFDALSQQEFMRLLKEHLLLLASAGQNGASWIQKSDSSFELKSMMPIYVRFQKPWLVISNSETEFTRASAALSSFTPQPESKFIVINWENSRWKYSRFMRRLDHGTYSGDEPLFFSENLDSLFQALYSIKKTTIEKSGSKEVVHYEIR